MTRLNAHYRLVPFVVACPLFLQNIDTTVMATALPSIATALGVRALDLNLAITAYLLSLAVFLPVSGWLAERYGPRRVFCGAILLFSLGSTLCGLAQSLPQLVVFRLLQGIGGALMVPIGRLILLRYVPASEMMSAMIWFTVPASIGRLVGPFFGGAVVTFVSWRWIFLVNIPFGLLGVLMTLRFVDKDLRVDAADMNRFDFKGFCLMATGLSGVLVGLEAAGKALLPWPASAALILAGALLLWAYHRYSRTREEPLIDTMILRYPTYRISILGSLPLRIAIGAAPFLLPLMLQLGFGLSPLKAGVLTMATGVGALGTRAIIARVIRRVGFRSLLIGASIMTSVFYVTYSLFTPSMSHVLMFGLLMVGGVCNSMAMVSLNTLGFTEIPRPRMSHATAGASMVQQVSLALGVVMGASLLTLTSHLHGGDANHLTAQDFSPAFVCIGAMTLLSAFAFRRLHPDEGDELRRR